MEILNAEFAGNVVRTWLIAAGVAVVVSVGLRVVLGVLTSRLGKLASKTTNNVDDSVVKALGRTRPSTLVVTGLAAGASALTMSAKIETVVHHVFLVVIMVQVGSWIMHATLEWLTRYRDRQMETDRGAATAVGAIRFVVLLVVWTMVLLITLSNMGVNITALITGLGVGGIAVALALQNVFSDLFAALSIVFDKPFVVGDFVIVGDFLGVVESVGLKSTRVRSLSGEQLAFNNSDMLGARIRNYGRMFERRVVFHLGVTYQTSQEHLKAIPGMVRAAVEEHEKTRFDRAHFQTFGDFALVFECVYYVLAPDYNMYMDIQQDINLSIRERFLAEGIEFAYPTQTLYLQRAAAEQTDE